MRVQWAVLVIASILILGTLGLSQEAFAVTNISTCQTLNTLGETYVLTTDISGISGDCFTITADNITLDGNGNSITGDLTGIGVSLSGRTGVTIKNLTIESFSTGINLSSSSSNTISGNTVSSNKLDGIRLFSSNDITISGNTVSNNNNSGILLQPSNGSTISSNTISDNNLLGILSFSSNNNNISSNTISGNGFGMQLIASSSNTISSNTISDNGGGIGIFASSDNTTISGNTVSGSSLGITISSSNSNTISGNTVSNNSNSGISLQDSNGSTISNNDVSNSNNGIELFSSSDMTISDNTVSNNNNKGIEFFSSSDNTISDNTVSNNNNGGISLSDSNSNTISGNTVSNNSGGISLNESNNNQVFNNNFIDNTNQASVSFSSGNIFNLATPTGGNYWNNFDEPGEGCDDVSPADGFCDDPFVFFGGQDNLPWATQNGWKNSPPVASDMTVDILENFSNVINLIASDPDGDPLTFIQTSSAGSGTTLFGFPTAGSVTYISGVTFSQTDSFSFKVNDGTVDSNIATVTVNSLGSITNPGDQLISVVDVLAPLGINISTDPSGGPTPAQISLCNNLLTILVPAGVDFILTCGSSTIDVIAGTITVQVEIDGILTEVTLDSGDFVTFNDDFTITNNDSTTATIEINGVPITIDVGETITIEGDQKKSCEALERAEESGQENKKGIERAKANNDCN